ncbi:MAG: hypothetical protein GXC73_14705 [Chitinophagaceae bacterium]|nr:hypothetical protein [Chitinophagaceae bacterium]
MGKYFSLSDIKRLISFLESNPTSYIVTTSGTIENIDRIECYPVGKKIAVGANKEEGFKAILYTKDGRHILPIELARFNQFRLTELFVAKYESIN